jgi:hypothetical protein
MPPERGLEDLTILLDEIDQAYDTPVAPRDPEELLSR